MQIKNTNLRNFLYGASGYALGGVVGFLFVVLVSKLGLARWLFNLIDQNQLLLQLLGTLLIVGLFLSLGGAVIGSIGGWLLASLMKTTHRTRLIASSVIAFAISTGLLTLVIIAITCWKPVFLQVIWSDGGLPIRCAARLPMRRLLKFYLRAMKTDWFILMILMSLSAIAVMTAVCC